MKAIGTFATVFISFFFYLAVLNDAASLFERNFNARSNANSFTVMYRANGDEYDKIVKYDSSASFLAGLDNIENNRIVRAVRNNQKKQAIVLELNAALINQAENVSDLVEDIATRFRDATAMELKYVLMDGFDHENQIILQLVSEFEGRDVAVIFNFNLIDAAYLIPYVSTININLVDYAGFDAAGKKDWSQEIKRLKSSATLLSLKKYLREFTSVTSNRKTVVDEPRAQPPQNVSAQQNQNSLSGRYHTFDLIPEIPRNSVDNAAANVSVGLNSCVTERSFTIIFKGISNYHVLRNGYHPDAAILVTRAEVISLPDMIVAAVSDGRKLILLVERNDVEDFSWTNSSDRLSQIASEFLNFGETVFEYFTFADDFRVTPLTRRAFTENRATEISRIRPIASENLEGFVLVDLEEEPAKKLRELDLLLDKTEKQPLSFEICVDPGAVVDTSGNLSVAERLTAFRNRYRIDPENYGRNDIHVTRENLFWDSIREIGYISDFNLISRNMRVTYNREVGVDVGGLTREWYALLAKQIFNPNFALFKSSETNQNAFRPFEGSGINANHLDVFTGIGRIIGKGMISDIPLNCHFTKSFYKLILGKKPNLNDLEEADAELYRTLCWMADNDIAGVMEDSTFTIGVEDVGGQRRDVILKDDGADINLSEENKYEYIRLAVEYKLETSIRDQVAAFLRGFHRVVSADSLKDFTVSELERLISGVSEIDVTDWENNTVYDEGYQCDSPQIRWFWQAVRTFDENQKRALLQYATGSPGVPVEGFSHLRNCGEIRLFELSRDIRSNELLPEAHTCFNRLDFPEYEDYETTRAKLLVAIAQVDCGYFMA